MNPSYTFCRYPISHEIVMGNYEEKWKRVKNNDRNEYEYLIEGEISFGKDLQENQNCQQHAQWHFKQVNIWVESHEALKK